MTVYNIVKLKNDPSVVGQVISDSQDHRENVMLDPEAQLTLKLKNGSEQKVKLREITDVSKDERFDFMGGNPHLVP